MIVVASALAACGGGNNVAPPQASAGSDASTATRRAEALATNDFGWTTIANEGESFSVAGTQTVRYGSGTSWIERQVSGTFTCSNDEFGSDPLFGVVKQCQVASNVAWTRIATEGESFTVTGTQTVRYGTGSSWIISSVTNGGACTNDFFGDDPAYGVVKACEVNGGGSAAPAPAPAPAASYSATVTWVPPSLNTDGTALTDVIGYRVSYGASAGNLDFFVSVPGGTSTSAVIDGLNAGTYYFAVTALNSTGVASAESSVVSRTFP